MSTDEHTISRTIYTSLDFLGDVGGLIDALNIIGSLLIWLSHGNNLVQYLIINTFKVVFEPSGQDMKHTDRNSIQQTKDLIKSRKKIKPSICPSPLCFRRDKSMNLEKCAERISKHLDILTYLRRMGMLECALKVIFNRQERFLLKH